MKERQAMIEKVGVLSIRHQCKILNIPRSNLYYTPSEESAENFKIMNLLDRQYLKMPYYGERRLSAILKSKGYTLSIKRLRRLMKKVCWPTIYPKRRTTVPNDVALKYPYLLKELTIGHPNQMWAIDITYIPMHKGFLYLFAIIDLYSRYVVGWSLSNTMTSQWCVKCLEEAFEAYGKPEIINSDQGSQFTSDCYINLLKDNGISISMDGRGRALDNIYIERLWRTVKQEYVYLNPCDTGDELWRGLDDYFRGYNESRPHQSLGYEYPASKYKPKLEVA